MKRLYSVVLPAIFLAAGSARAAVMLNFDDLTGASNTANGALVPDASVLPYDYYESAYGLDMSCFVNSAFGTQFIGVGVAKLGSAASSPPNAIVGIDLNQDFGYSEFLTFSFVDPSNSSVPATTDFFSMQDPINSGKQITMYAFDVSGNALGSTTQTANGSATWSLSIPGISFIRFGDPTTNQIFSADNVTFDPVTVPEPASLLLLAGVAAIGLRRLTGRGFRQEGHGVRRG